MPIPFKRLPRRARHMLLGVIFSGIAPLGWWLISGFVPDAWQTLVLYSYLLVGAMLIFATFGYIVGHFQDSMFDLLEQDNLTVVLNQKAFFRRLDAVYQLGLRYGDHVAVIMIDIDNFKHINDKHFNHQVGSDILKELAILFKDCMRETDIVARFGGDEFVIALPRLAEHQHAELVAERLRRAVDERIFHSRGHEFRVTISLGVVISLCQSGMKVEELVQQADQMLYKAKHNGRNRVEILLLKDQSESRLAVPLAE